MKMNLALNLLFFQSASAFTNSRTSSYSKHSYLSGSLLQLGYNENARVTAAGDAEADSRKAASFLKFFGTYPALGLRFPDLATQSQREREVSGISLDFILDTAANTNTINAQVAQELGLESVGEALAGFGAAGAVDGGETFFLGNCTFDMPDKELFMTDLTASALPIASPAAAGILGVAFLNCFEGGVQFQWGGGIDARQPMVTFYGEKSDVESHLKDMTRVPIQVIDGVLLPSVTLKIGETEIPALLDTGSPVTVLNSAAAELAGVTTVTLDNEIQESEKNSGFNPFKKFTDNFKAAQSMAEAVSKGDVLVMGGSDGQRIDLRRTNEEINLILGQKGEVPLPKSYIYIGDLPGLKTLGAFNGSSSAPAAILGMDILRRLPEMIYRGMQNEIYFPKN